MKKIALISSIALFAVVFTSCKKKYTCECTTTTNGANPTVTLSAETTEKMKKSDAKAQCNLLDYEETVNNTTVKTDCEIK